MTIEKKLIVISKREGRLKEQEGLLGQYTNSLVTSSKGVKTEQLVERNTIGK